MTTAPAARLRRHAGVVRKRLPRPNLPCGHERRSTIRQTERSSMRIRITLPVLAAVAVTGLGLTGAAQAQQADMSFVITSVGKGNGADLGGLAGADAHCLALAKAAGSTYTNWRAYLSTTEPGGTAGVNARDRIGQGPWQNAKGTVVGKSIEELP